MTPDSLTESLISSPPYDLPAPEKEERLLAVLNALTAHHREHCPEYERMITRFHSVPGPASCLEEVPWIPVGIFKLLRLASVPAAEMFRTLKSSGTTSAQTSQIVLDRRTAALQSKALSGIMRAWLGGTRRPMIVLESPTLVQDRSAYSARTAGVLGMSMFGRDHFYALHPDMSLDVGGLNAWLEKHRGIGPLVFGFTFIAWSYFFQRLEPGLVDLSGGILIHGGGWKKLVDSALSPEQFKAEIERRTGLSRVHDYYGMVEQTGSIYVECESGYLHAPACAHVIVRDERDWRPAAPGQPGVVQVLSALPLSYPGHSILTEDRGIVLGNDGCSCGRRGAYFRILGRVPRAIARGCSDTHVGPPGSTAA